MRKGRRNRGQLSMNEEVGPGRRDVGEFQAWWFCFVSLLVMRNTKV